MEKNSLSPIEKLTFQILKAASSQTNNLLLKKHLLLAQNTNTRLFPQKSSLAFQSRFNTNIKNCLKNSTQKNYSYNKKNIFSACEDYEVIEAYNKKTKEKKIAKIYSKKIIEEKFSSKYVKREIVLHQILKDSDCILRMEDVFETKNHIYLIFEFGKILKGNEDNFGFMKNKQKLKNMGIDVLIALSEISSLHCTVGTLHSEMVLQVNKENFKLFNFDHILYFGEILPSRKKLIFQSWNSGENDTSFSSRLSKNLKEKQGIEKIDYEVSWLKKFETASPHIDSIYFGLFLGSYFKRHTFQLQKKKKFDDDYFSELKLDGALSQIEKDFFSCLLQETEGKIIKIDMVILHSFFNSDIVENKKYHHKLTKCFDDEKFSPSSIKKILKAIKLNFDKERLKRTKGIFRRLKHGSRQADKEKITTVSRKRRRTEFQRNHKKPSLIQSNSIHLKSIKLSAIPKGRREFRNSLRRSSSKKTIKTNHSKFSTAFNIPRTPRRREMREIGKKNFKKKPSGFFKKFFSSLENLVCCNEREPPICIEKLNIFSKKSE